MTENDSTLGDRLAMLLQKGDSDALREFIVLASPTVYTVLGRLGFRNADREDVFQEVFMRIVAARDTFDRTRSILPWIYAITMNTARTKFRQLQTLATRIDGTSETSVDQRTNQFHAVAAKELMTAIEFHLQTLPVPQREAFVLCCLEHREQQEAAHVLGIPEATLRTNLRRARLALARMLVRERYIPPREDLV